MWKACLIVAVVSCSHSAEAVAGVAGQAVKGVARKLVGEAAESAVKKTAKYVGARAAANAAAETAEIAARRAGVLASLQFGKAVTAAPHFMDDFAVAAAKLTARNERRLMMMAPALAESGQAGTVVARLSAGNTDELLETLWKHKDKLASAAVVTGLLVHGDEIVETTGEVVEATGRYVAKPVIDGAMENVVAPVSRLLVSAIILAAVIALGGLAAFLFGGEATGRVTANVRKLVNLFSR